MDKATTEMTKRELAESLGGGESATEWYLAHMTKDQIKEQVEYLRGERTQDQLTYKYDH